MEELREITEAYLAGASVDIKTAARSFFNAMDSNFDNKVSLDEFLEFMRKERYQHLRSSDLFKKVCRGNSANLEFLDVMTLYYIIRSGRPFCNGCDEFITNIYFCCTECFHSSKTNYCLCIKCYKDKKHSHPHHQFLDNFTLLEVKRSDKQDSSRREHIKQQFKQLIKGSDQKNDGETSLQHGPAEQEIIEKRRIALKALEKSLAAASHVATVSLCAIL